MRCWRRASRALVFTLLLIPCVVVSCCGGLCPGCKLTPDDAVTIASALSQSTKLQVLYCGSASAYLVFVNVPVVCIVLSCAWRMVIVDGFYWQRASSLTRSCVVRVVVVTCVERIGNGTLGTSGVQTLLNGTAAATMKKISFHRTCGDNVS